MSALLTLRVRLLLVLSSLSALLFIQEYCTSVCPFIDGLKPEVMARNLFFVFLFHLGVRELLYRLFSRPWKTFSLPRQAYLLSVASWLAAGVAALALHDVLYPDFPMGSHLKMLSGYWILGGGILAQMEYVLFEHRYRKLPPEKELPAFDEKIGRRVLESLLLFTLAPSLTMLLVVIRYNYEGVLPSKVAVEVLYVGVLALAGSGLVALFFGSLLRKDATAIVGMVEKIRSGVFGERLTVRRPDELGEIASGVNHMAEGLGERERLRDAFGRFVDPKVAAAFMEHHTGEGWEIKLGGKRRYAVILMCDLRNFTPLSETLEAEALMGLLNDYFREMVAAIQENGGTVDKFIGDAVMAVFGIPDPQGAETAALRAALEMRRRLERLNADLEARGLPRLENGIGVHAGEVVAGYLGSEERLEFTVIGNPVNLASRIEGATKRLGRPILFSRRMAEAVSEAFSVARVGETDLKGIAEPVPLYTVGE